MKKLRFLLLLFAIILLASKCEKEEKGIIDDQGQMIVYYKDKIGVGYLFYKYSDGEIAQIGCRNLRIRSQHGEYGKKEWLYSDEYVITDTNGKYAFKFVKTIDKKEAHSYVISFYDEASENYYFDPLIISPESVISGGEQIIVDTLFIQPRHF